MENPKLNINRQEFEAHYELLQELAEHLPDEPSSRDLADALLDMGITSISKTLIYDSTYSLTMEQMDRIWAEGNIELRRELSGNRSFLRRLTDKQASDIMEMDDIKILVNAAEEANLFYSRRRDREHYRLSTAAGKALLEFMLNHKSPAVRGTLAKNTGIPKSCYPSLKEAVGFGVDHCNLANMTIVDVEYLPKAAYPLIEDIADNIERIKNAEVRAAVADWLMKQEYFIRARLADNPAAPKFALEKLSADVDPDVVYKAKKSLNNQAEYIY